MPVDNVWLHYTTDNGLNEKIKMQRDGDDYFAYIMKQPYYSLVNYHFSIDSPFDNKHIELMNDGKKYFFFVGYDTMFYDNSTTDKGYTIIPSSTQYRWQRVNLDSVDRDYWKDNSYWFLPPTDVTGDSYCWFVTNRITSQQLDSSSMVLSLNANSDFRYYILMNFMLSSVMYGDSVTPAFSVSVRNGSQGT